MSVTQYVILGIASLATGYSVFLVLLYLLPKKLLSDSLFQKKLIFEEAKTKIKAAQEEELSFTSTRIQLANEELEGLMRDRSEDFENMEKELALQEELAAKEEARVVKLEQDASVKTRELEALKDTYKKQIEEHKNLTKTTQAKLEVLAGVSTQKTKEGLRENLVESRQIECTKYLKIISEELAASIKRLASRNLARVLARYCPNFIWPKVVNHVEITKKRFG